MPFEVHFGCWGCLGPHVGGPWRCQGLGLGPRVARGRQSGLDGTPVRAGALFCWDPGIQATAKVEGDLMLLGRTVYQSNIRQSAIRLGK